MPQTEEIFQIPKSIISEGHLLLMHIDGNPGIPEVAAGDWVVARDDITPGDVGPDDIVAVMSHGDAALRSFRQWNIGTETFIGKAVTVLHQL